MYYKTTGIAKLTDAIVSFSSHVHRYPMARHDAHHAIINDESRVGRAFPEDECNIKRIHKYKN